MKIFITNPNVSGDMRVYKSWVITMLRVCQNATLFPPALKDPTATLHHGFSAEDWYRAHAILRYYHRLHARASAPDTKKRRSHEKQAIKPLYLTIEDRANTSVIRPAPLLSADGKPALADDGMNETTLKR